MGAIAKISPVTAFYAGGISNGGPGLRPVYANYYEAFVLPPDGYNIEAVCHLQLLAP